MSPAYVTRALRRRSKGAAVASASGPITGGTV